MKEDCKVSGISLGGLRTDILHGWVGLLSYRYYYCKDREGRLEKLIARANYLRIVLLLFLEGKVIHGEGVKVGEGVAVEKIVRHGAGGG